MTMTQRKEDDTTESKRFKLHTCPTPILSFIRPLFPSSIHTLPSLTRVFQFQGQYVITRNRCTLAIPRQNWVSSRTVVYTHTREEEVDAIWPRWEANPENSSTLLLPSFPLYMTWRPNSSVKHRVIFSPLIIAWESQCVFLSLNSFQSLLEKVIIICSNCIHSIPWGKGI